MVHASTVGTDASTGLNTVLSTVRTAVPLKPREAPEKFI
jgi:hypothetical protein